MTFFLFQNGILYALTTDTVILIGLLIQGLPGSYRQWVKMEDFKGNLWKKLIRQIQHILSHTLPFASDIFST